MGAILYINTIKAGSPTCSARRVRRRAEATSAACRPSAPGRQPASARTHSKAAPSPTCGQAGREPGGQICVSEPRGSRQVSGCLEVRGQARALAALFLAALPCHAWRMHANVSHSRQSVASGLSGADAGKRGERCWGSWAALRRPTSGEVSSGSASSDSCPSSAAAQAGAPAAAAPRAPSPWDSVSRMPATRARTCAQAREGKGARLCFG